MRTSGRDDVVVFAGFVMQRKVIANNHNYLMFM